MLSAGTLMGEHDAAEAIMLKDGAGMERKSTNRPDTIIAAVAALGLAASMAGTTLLQAQPPAQGYQQQAVPDAPKPQTLPSLTTVVPVAPAVPGTPASTAVTQPAMPNTPLPEVPAQPVSAGDNNMGQQVETPAAGHGAVDIPVDDPTPQGPIGPGSKLQVYTTFVEVPFLVKDSRGQMVPGLTARDVQVFENGTRQPIRYFTTDPFPLSVALVIDQSVPFKVMDQVNAALGAIQSAFSAYDQIAVFTYNNGVKMQDPIGFDGAASARLGAILDQSKGKGREVNLPLGGPLAQTNMINGHYEDPNTTPNHRGGNGIEYPEREYHTLNDAILAAAIQVARTTNGPGGEHRRRIVYVVSDGKEYGSKAKEKDVIKFCQTNNIAVYATLVGDSSLPVVGFLDRIHLPLTIRDNVLPRYTTATGGQLDAEVRERGIEESFAKIAEESRAQYFLGFYSKLPPYSEKFRTLDVTVLRPNLTVIAREGYYPNAAPNRPASVPAAAASTAPPVAPATAR